MKNCASGLYSPPSCLVHNCTDPLCRKLVTLALTYQYSRLLDWRHSATIYGWALHDDGTLKIVSYEVSSDHDYALHGTSRSPSSLLSLLQTTHSLAHLSNVASFFCSLPLILQVFYPSLTSLSNKGSISPPIPYFYPVTTFLFWHWNLPVEHNNCRILRLRLRYWIFSLLRV